MKTQTELLYEAYHNVYLTEEEKQLELLKKTKSGYEPRSMTPSATRKQKGVPVEGGRKEKEETTKKEKSSPGQLSLDLKKKKSYGEKVGRVLTTLDKIAKAKFERGLGKRKTSDEALRRFTRRELAKEDYFDIIADYLLENFEFESEQHLLQTMTYIDEETIDEILMEVKGLGGEVDPDSGEYTGRRSRAQRYRRLAGTEGARSRTYSSGGVTSGGRLSKPNSTSTMIGAGKGQASSKHPEMKRSPLEKAKTKYDTLRQRGENKRANKISKFLERGGNRYD